MSADPRPQFGDPVPAREVGRAENPNPPAGGHPGFLSVDEVNCYDFLHALAIQVGEACLSCGARV